AELVHRDLVFFSVGIDFGQREGSAHGAHAATQDRNLYLAVRHGTRPVHFVPVDLHITLQRSIIQRRNPGIGPRFAGYGHERLEKARSVLRRRKHPGRKHWRGMSGCRGRAHDSILFNRSETLHTEPNATQRRAKAWNPNRGRMPLLEDPSMLERKNISRSAPRQIASMLAPNLMKPFRAR